MCVYADTFGLALECQRRFSWRSICGISWHHKCSGKLSVIPLSTDTKWSFHVWIAFSARLRICSSGGTSWYVIPDSLMAVL